MKKCISIVLICCMIVMFPISVSAKFYDGTCGEDVDWSFDSETGILEFE